MKELLEAKDWTSINGKYWKRPGQTKGISAVLKNESLFILTTAAKPFKVDTTYSYTEVFVLLS